MKKLILKTTPSKTNNLTEWVDSDARILISKKPNGKFYHHDSALGKTEIDLSAIRKNHE